MPATSQGYMQKRPPSAGEMPKHVLPGFLHWNAKDLTGRRFGKLEVIEEHGRNSKRSLTWLCLCDCGNSVVRVGSTLICGKSTSCGCNIKTPEACLKKSLAQRKPKSSIRKAYRSYSSNAEARGISFSLSFDEFERLTAMACVYCGEPPSQVKRSTFGCHVANGIDRADNNIGYADGNCVPCCKTCNFMKRDAGVKEFIERCARIAAVGGVSFQQ